nr:uncharacterized protein LOC117275219 [Nicotiana tomentosiformis]
MMNLYSPKIFCVGMINLCNRGYHALISSMDDDNDRGWMERFVAISSGDIIPTTTSSFPVAWNRSPIRWVPLAVGGLDRWVQKSLDITTPEIHFWKELSIKYGWKAKNYG